MKIKAAKALNFCQKQAWHHHTITLPPHIKHQLLQEQIKALLLIYPDPAGKQPNQPSKDQLFDSMMKQNITFNSGNSIRQAHSTTSTPTRSVNKILNIRLMISAGFDQ